MGFSGPNTFWPHGMHRISSTDRYCWLSARLRVVRSRTTSIIIIFISRLPGSHKPIELVTIKQQNREKEKCKNLKYEK